MKLGPYELDTIITGDALELAKAIPDESVDLIHTDPPYPEEFLHVWDELSEYAGRVLKPGGSMIVVCGHYQVPYVLNAINGGLHYHWIGWLNHAQKSTSMAFRTVRGGKPFIWFAKGNPIIKWGFVWDTKPSEGMSKKYHDWGQPPLYILRDIQCLTAQGDIVFDPFTGGGTVPAVCKMLGRHYLAFEIDPKTADDARQRVYDTQSPLLIPQSEQMAIEVMV